MQARKFLFTFLVLISLLALNACEYETIVPDTPDPGKQVSYATDIQPIFTAKCAGCHGRGLTPPDLSAGTSYNSLMNGGYVTPQNPSSSIIYVVMASGGSMSQYSNASQAALVLQWIQQGALNN
jgi:mono/diheme cytochrome c family protein